jgi:hypothetical protein
MLKNQEVRGDEKDIPMSGASWEGDYDKSLGGEISRSQMTGDGYKPMGGIASDTTSDKGKDA